MTSEEPRRSKASVASLAFAASVAVAAPLGVAALLSSSVPTQVALPLVGYAVVGSGLGVAFGAGTLFRVWLRSDTLEGSRLSIAATALSGLVGLSFVGLAGLVLWGLSHAMHGRPLRFGGRPWRPGLRRGGATSPPREGGPDLAVPAARRTELAAAWAGNALAEHASIGAFERLAAELAAARAPRSLVGRALAARAEEVDHAARCFALATAYAGLPLAPEPLPRLPPRPLTLAELAVEALVDGCLHEGFAAELARRARDRAVDPVVHEVLAVIAADEASHAALSDAIVSWAIAAGGPAVARAVSAAAKTLPSSPVGGSDAVVVAGLVAPTELALAWGSVRSAVAARYRDLPAEAVGR